jgi:hypothetical protein
MPFDALGLAQPFEWAERDDHIFADLGLPAFAEELDLGRVFLEVHLRVDMKATAHQGVVEISRGSPSVQVMWRADFH